jgi:hypothetical protein
VFNLLKKAANITRVAIVPPQPLPDRHGLAIVAIVKNEGRYVREWANFHARAGVRHFYIYDNGSTDNTVAELGAALPSSAITIIPWDQKFYFAPWNAEIHNQVLAYAHATRNFGSRFRWMTWIDIDEFLIPKQAPDLDAALAHLADQKMISLPWHMFGRSGHQVPPEGGVVPNYTRRNPNPMDKSLLKFKVIADPCAVTACKVHWMEVAGLTDSSNDAGKTASLKGRTAPEFYAADHIQLNHYYTRSDADVAEKLARGPNITTAATDNQRRVMRKVAQIEAAEIEDRAAAIWWARHASEPVSENDAPALQNSAQ